MTKKYPFCFHKHRKEKLSYYLTFFFTSTAGKCPEILLATPEYVATNMAGNVLGLLTVWPSRHSTNLSSSEHMKCTTLNLSLVC